MCWGITARKRHRDALRCMKTLTQDPTNAVYWFYYGVACFENSLYLKALNAYLRAVHLNSEFSLAWIHIAKLCSTAQSDRGRHSGIQASGTAGTAQHECRARNRVAEEAARDKRRAGAAIRRQTISHAPFSSNAFLVTSPSPSAAVHYDSPLVDPSAPSSVLALPSQPTAPHQLTHADVFLSGPGGQPSLSALPGIPVTSSQAVAVSASDTKRRVPGGAEHSSPPRPSEGGQSLALRLLRRTRAWQCCVTQRGRGLRVVYVAVWVSQFEPVSVATAILYDVCTKSTDSWLCRGANVAKSTESPTQKQHSVRL